jgi:hypothetical protein
MKVAQATGVLFQRGDFSPPILARNVHARALATAPTTVAALFLAA